MILSEVISRTAGFLALTALLGLLYCVLRFAEADWLSKDRTVESVRAALVLAPDNWEFYQEWAEISPNDSSVALRNALLLNSSNAGLWLEMAASEEDLGKMAAAEAHLIRAVELDRSSGTKTLLAEFYFRNHKANLFWPAARAAFHTANILSESLLKDCWLLSSDATFIRQQVMPERAEAVFQYLQFLLTENHLDAAHAVAVSFMAQPCCSVQGTMNAIAVRDLFTSYIDRLAVLNEAEDVITAWNWLSARKLVPYEPLVAQSRTWVVNDSFQNAPFANTSNGLDWRQGSAEGMFVEYILQEQGIKVTFTGRQPEHCGILAEYVVLQPARHYRLRVKYATSSIDERSGLAWRVVMPSGEDLLSHDPVNKNGAVAGGTGPLGPEEKEQTFSFVGPAQQSVARLVLAYDRLLGTVRIDGTMKIHKVDGTFD